MNTRVKGFTLIEIMIVVTLLGLLMAMAIPALAKTRRAAKFSAFAHDIRSFKGSVETYYLETGIIPEDSGSGTLTAEMAEYINAELFQRQTVFGGSWDIESNDSGITLGIGVHGYELSDADLLLFDEKYDDGNLASGVFRKITGDRYYFVIED